MLLKYKSIAVILIVVFFNVSSLGDIDRFKTSKRAVPASGNYFLSISIGGKVKKSATLKLRDTMSDILVSAQGGYYDHVLDINEYNNSSTTIDSIERKMSLVAKKVERHRRSHPDQKRRVFVSLLGHGKWDKDSQQYKFLVSRDELIAGEKMVELLTQFKADEIIIVVNSCKSGGLATQHMLYFAQEMKKHVRKYASGKAVALMTPVNRFINSHVYAWEEILTESFRSATDKNKNNGISYGEWKAEIKRLARQHPGYMPYSLSQSMIQKYGQSGMGFHGIDPKFFEVGINPQETIFLTPQGVDKLRQGQLILNSAPKSFGVISSEKLKLHDQHVSQLVERLFEKLMYMDDAPSEEQTREFVAELSSKPGDEARIRHFVDMVTRFAESFGSPQGPATILAPKCVKTVASRKSA